MDSNTAVPKKIYRHVLKAISHYASTTDDDDNAAAEGVQFDDIYNYVQFCNKNLRPVANLKLVVKKVLLDFEERGLIDNNVRARYRFAIPQSGAINKSVQHGNNSEREFGPNSKRRRLSNDSINEVNPTSIRKIFTPEKPLPTGKKANVSNNEQTEGTSTGCENMNCSENIFTEDGSTLVEPGADDRDSGDDSCVRSQTSLPNKNTAEDTQCNYEAESEEANPNQNPNIPECSKRSSFGSFFSAFY